MRLALALVVLVVPVLTVSCVDAGRRDAHNEANLVVARYDAVRNAPVAERDARVAQLRSVGVRDREVRRVRDLCADVYAAFGRATVLSDQARVRFERFSALPPEQRLATEARELERMLTDADGAARTAQQGITPCIDGIGRIRAQYGARPR